MPFFDGNKNIKTKNFSQKVTLFLSQILITIQASILFSHFKALNFFLNPRTDFMPLSAISYRVFDLLFVHGDGSRRCSFIEFSTPIFLRDTFVPPPFKHPFIPLSFVSFPHSYLLNRLEIKNQKFLNSNESSNKKLSFQFN